MELLKEIWSTARRNKLRTSLTGFAVAWGIFMIIFLLGAGNGLINAQVEHSSRYLSSSMVLFGGFTSKAYKGLREGRYVRLDDRDIDYTNSHFENHVRDAGGIQQHGGVHISKGDKYVSGQTLSGVTAADVRINRRDMYCGRFVNELDNRECRKVVVLSEAQAKELAGHGAIPALVGQYVKVDALVFKGVGVTKDNQQQQDNNAYTAYTTLKRIYGLGDAAGAIQFMVDHLETEEQSEALEQAVRTAINLRHGAAPDDEAALWVGNRFAQGLQMAQGIRIIRTALWVIGIFTLLSGVVGVSNIMLITVKERTREFGVRKAIGAKPWHILRLILVESVITTAFFGYVGMFCGVAANAYMDATIGREVVDTGLFQATMFLDPTVGIDVCLQATFVIILAGTLAGLMPALKAARVRPIEALRRE